MLLLVFMLTNVLSMANVKAETVETPKTETVQQITEKAPEVLPTEPATSVNPPEVVAPPAEEVKVAEPVVEAPVVEETVVEPPVADLPAAEEPIKSDPIVEKPVTEIPVTKDEPVVAPTVVEPTVTTTTEPKTKVETLDAAAPDAKTPVSTVQPEPALKTVAPLVKAPAVSAPTLKAPLVSANAVAPIANIGIMAVIGTPGHYTTDSTYIPLSIKLNALSTNDHTEFSLAWMQGGKLYIAIASTHPIANITVNNVPGTEVAVYGDEVNIFVDGKEYVAKVALSGSTKKAHWTIYSFDPANINLSYIEVNEAFVEGNGVGHNVTGELVFNIPDRNLIINKTWGPGTTPKALQFEIYGINASNLNGVLIDTVTLAAPTNGAMTSSGTFPVPIASNLGELYTTYKIVERGAETYNVTYADPIGDSTDVNSTFTLGVKNDLITIDIPVTKIWTPVEGEPTHPDITLNLYQNDNAVPYKTYVLLSGETTYTFENVPMYDPEGVEYIYTVKETPLNEYTTNYSADTFEITNEYKTISVTGTKIWIGAPVDYVYPQIELQLNRNGVAYKKGTITYPAETILWENLPEVDPDGKPYVYTVTELTELKDFTKVEKELTVTNTYKTTSVKATKNWIDVPEGYVVKDIQLQLYKDGVKFGDPVTLVSGKTEYIWEGVPELRKDGTAFEYTVKELTALPDFKVSEKGLDVTNTYMTIDVTGTKIWVGGYSPKPPIQLQLMQGTVAYGNPITLTDPNLSYTWPKVPLKDSLGKEYVYTVVEVTDLKDYNKNETGLVVTNTYRTVDKTATKTWVGVPAGYVIPEIKLQLNQDGKPFGDPVVLASGTTTYEWKDLPDVKPDGTPFVYTVTEVTELKDFTKVEAGLTVTNTYKTVSKTANKAWVSVPDGYVIPDIKLQLMQDGKAFGAPVTLASGTFDYTWDNLPELKADGTPFVYTVTEVTDLKDFAKVEAGLNVTNTYKTVEKTATKNWEGVPAGFVIPDITLQLNQNGKPNGDPIVLKSGNLNYTWKGLPEVAADGKVYDYTVTEVTELKEFTKTESGMAVTNKYSVVDITVNKIWKDVPSEFKIPNVEIELLQNGKPIGEIVRLVSPTTSYTWKNLPKYMGDGTEYKYTVRENTKLSNFTVAYSADGLTVTNTYKKPLPNTGEENNMALPIVGVGLLGVGLAVLLKRRRQA